MLGTIVPLRFSNDASTPPARIDRAATELLTTGRAADLQAARVEAILSDLQLQRDRFVSILADLRGREPADRIDVVATQATLAITIALGIVQIDAFIARIRTSTGPGGMHRPG